MQNVFTTVAQMGTSPAATDVQVEQLVGAFMIGLLLGALLLAIPLIAGRWKMFQKAKKPGWAAIVPIYSTYVELQVARLNKWWLAVPVLAYASAAPGYIALASGGMSAEGTPVGDTLSLIFGIASIVLAVKIVVRLADHFGRSRGFAAVLFFVPFIGYPMLGFGKDKYKPVKNRPVFKKS